MENYRAAIDFMIVRPWIFIEPEGDVFLTCDNPVVLIGPQPVGIENASIVHWPLSPNRALWRVLPDSEDRRVFRMRTASADLVAELNQMTADQAIRQVIWRPGTNPIASITRPSGPLLRSINGMPIGEREWSYDKIRPQWSHIIDAAQARRNQQAKNRRE